MNFPTPVLEREKTCARGARVSAFTLIELLTVIAIVGILAAIIIPVVGKVRESAKQTTSVSRLRAIGVVTMLYVQDNKGVYPTNAGPNPADRWPIKVISYFPDAERVYKAGLTAALYDNRIVSSYFKCPTQTIEDGATGARGVYGLNNRIGGTGSAVPPAIRASKVSQPSQFILYGTTDGINGATGGQALAVSGPANRATALGFSGATAGSGLSPNFGRKAVITFADGRVEARDICSATAWPWVNPAASFEL
jgi:prepilin-type N-terminal cleavage/methylation domain-containing protein